MTLCLCSLFLLFPARIGEEGVVADNNSDGSSWVPGDGRRTTHDRLCGEAVRPADGQRLYIKA